MRFAIRLAWAAMLVAHVPALVDAAAQLGWSAASWLRLLLLGVSHALFVLKLLDVPWLRLPADRRAGLALVLCVAILHAGPLTRAHVPLELAVENWQAVLLAGALLSVPPALAAYLRTGPCTAPCRSQRRFGGAALAVRPVSPQRRACMTGRADRAPPPTFNLC
ncbi:MAG: hypothetical protein LC135_02330 [Phycisphaerae bacterium]|nr:hypothetical protein [Phycisphaerae bacterium]MCZ2398690.1 hypothetical protein [Phycisphaerae bacterium]